MVCVAFIFSCDGQARTCIYHFFNKSISTSPHLIGCVINSITDITVIRPKYVEYLHVYGANSPTKQCISQALDCRQHTINRKDLLGRGARWMMSKWMSLFIHANLEIKHLDAHHVLHMNGIQKHSLCNSISQTVA